MAAIAAIATFCPRATAQMPTPPKLAAGQTFAIDDSLTSRNSTAMTGTGLGYALPAPSHGEFIQTISRTLAVLAVDAGGGPAQFSIKYNTVGVSEDGVRSADALAGRSFELHVSDSSVDVTDKDGKSLASADRARITEDAKKFRDYLQAAAQFSSLSLNGTDFQMFSAPLMCKIIGLPPGQVKAASIRKQTSVTSLTFDLRMTVAAPQNDGGEILVSGTMTIQPDWSVLSVSVENKATRRSGSEKDKIRVVVDTTWSLDLSRKMIRQ